MDFSRTTVVLFSSSDVQTSVRFISTSNCPRVLFLPPLTHFPFPRHLRHHHHSDWFTAWPGDALVAVAKMFLASVEFRSDETRLAIVESCQRFHEDTSVLSEHFLSKLKRQNYVTPTRSVPGGGPHILHSPCRLTHDLGLVYVYRRSLVQG